MAINGTWYISSIMMQCNEATDDSSSRSLKVYTAPNGTIEV
jgi:hypothetical protein